MKRIIKRITKRLSILFLAFALLLTGAVGLCDTGVFSPRAEYEYLAGSAVWQLSAESKALMLQAFQLAKANISSMSAKWETKTNDDGVSEAYCDGKRVAVICDIDDTLVDGASYTANIVGFDGDMNNVAFARFVLSDGCSALPGAVEFTNFCVDMGLEVFYVTYRYDQGYKIGQSDSFGGYPESGGGKYLDKDGNEIGTTIYQVFGKSFFDITLERMAELGFPIDENHLILHDGKVIGGTKEQDRAAIRGGAEGYPNGRRIDGNAGGLTNIDIEPHFVALYLGDQMSDFTDDFDAAGLNAMSRAELTEKYSDKIGSEWIILPNAVYGKAMDYALTTGVTDVLEYYDYTNIK